MTHFAEVTFKGMSGENYIFKTYALNTIFHNIGAIYAFCKNKDNNFIPLYIGKSDKLKERIANHEKWDCVIPFGCNCICVMPVLSEIERDYIEPSLIKYYKPPCNEQFT